MSLPSKDPISPVRAIFHDVLSAESDESASRDLRRAVSYGSSLPPQSAAALLHASQVRPAPHEQSRLQETSSLKPAQLAQAFSDAKLTRELLMDEPGASWRPPFPSDQIMQPDLGELRDAILTLKNCTASLMQQLTPQLVQLTRLIAQRVILKEALNDPDLPLRLVQQSLTTLDHRGQVNVMLGAAFAHGAEQLQSQLERDGVRCEVQVLEHLAPYACQVKTQLGAVDESLETRLDQVLRDGLDTAQPS